MNFEIMHSVMNFVEFIEDHWTAIIMLVCLINLAIVKIKNYMKLNDEEKLEVTKRQIKETMLKFITEAEVDYLEWVSAGSIKRSQVIDELYAIYPILSKVADQDALIKWIDDTIDESLETMRKIFEDNREADNVEETV